MIPTVQKKKIEAIRRWKDGGSQGTSDALLFPPLESLFSDYIPHHDSFHRWPHLLWLSPEELCDSSGIIIIFSFWKKYALFLQEPTPVNIAASFLGSMPQAHIRVINFVMISFILKYIEWV